MPEAENWQPIADTLGFRDEAEMLKHLYIQQDFSLEELHQILGYSVWAVRRRLILNSIPLRPRGGPDNRSGKRRLKHLTDQDLLETPAADLAARHQVHYCTVYAEIKFREKEKSKRVALLSNHAGKSVREILDRQQSLDGASSASTHSRVPEVLPGEGGER